MKQWLIVAAYLMFVLSATGYVSWLFLADRLPAWLPTAMFFVVIAVGWVAHKGLDSAES